MRSKELDRRRLLQVSALTALGSLAGCESPQSGDTATGTTTDAPETTPTPSTTQTGGGAPPGSDQLGGPDALQSFATVEATVLSADEGAGQYVNTPAIVWIEQDASVTWNITEGSHSITAYHPDYDKPLRIPDGASPFDSEILGAGNSYEHTFETTGVYNYYCKPHEGLGMLGW